MTSPSGTAPVGSRRMAPGTAAVLGLLVMVGVMACLLRICAPETPRFDPSLVDLSLPDWRPSTVELQQVQAAEQTRRSAAPDEGYPGRQALLGTYVAFNQADLRFGGAARHPDISDARADYEQRALAFLRREGHERFMALGQVVTDDFMKAIAEGDAEQMERLGGMFTRLARSSGLLTSSAQLTPDAAPVVRAAFLSQWVGAVVQARPAVTLMLPLERLLLLRWKLVANALVPLGRRAAVGDEVRRLDPGFPTLQALAAHAASAGDWLRAARLYAAALREDPEDERLRATAAFSAAQARARSQGSRG